MIPLRRRPAVMRPVAEPDTYESRIAALNAEVARLEALCASKERTIGHLDRNVTGLSDALDEERRAHQAAMSQRPTASVPADSDLLRELAQERRNNVALSEQLAEARAKRNVPVRMGGWGR